MSHEVIAELVINGRKRAGLSQEQLAARVKISRSTIAHLERLRRMPSADVLRRIFHEIQEDGTRIERYLSGIGQLRLQFECSLSKLVGRTCALAREEPHVVDIAEEQLAALFGSQETERQVHDRLSALLTHYNIDPPSLPFLCRFFPSSAFETPSSFDEQVESYLAIAIRLRPSFATAFVEISRTEDLDGLLSPTEERSLEPYRARSQWGIERIEKERLSDLGYIAAAEVKRESADRARLCAFLEELAEAIAKDGRTALSRFSERQRAAMSALLRRFHSGIEHDFMSPLFPPDVDALRREAERLRPQGEADISRMGATQEKGKRNLARYLTADAIDVYLATSMRDQADFVAVSEFSDALFAHQKILPLKLRYFDPTQSWISDRVAKGLVEALMLRRCSVAVYMAQKSDTFGKDSEASVALGQGKPVIVYVPRLVIGKTTSSQIWETSRTELISSLSSQTTDDTDLEELDHQALASAALQAELSKLSDAEVHALVQANWADFGLPGEAERFPEDEGRAEYRTYLDGIQSGMASELPSQIRERLLGVFVAVSVTFEKRARVFREVHPLALQVIAQTGVLNGILVARSVETCAELLREVLANKLQMVLEVDDDNYQLVEKRTRSAVRVISRNRLVAAAYNRAEQNS